MESRISAARERANRANNVLLGSAVALFVAALVAARVAHPARASHTPTTSSTASSSTTSSPSTDGYSDDSGNGYYGGDYYGSGSTAPSQSEPQLSTGGS